MSSRSWDMRTWCSASRTPYACFEMVRYSDPEMAWRLDRLHVSREMVGHIVSSFVGVYFSREELGTVAAASSQARPREDSVPQSNVGLRKSVHR